MNEIRTILTITTIVLYNIIMCFVSVRKQLSLRTAIFNDDDF